MQIIKSSDDISELFKTGNKLSNKYLTFIFKQRKLNTTDKKHDLSGRVAFIAGKKLGNAVWRNSSKRRMREIYRSLINSYKELNNLDILFIAKSNLLKAPYQEVLNQSEKTIKKIISNSNNE